MVQVLSGLSDLTGGVGVDGGSADLTEPILVL